jgi:hypothetical protein
MSFLATVQSVIDKHIASSSRPQFLIDAFIVYQLCISACSILYIAIQGSKDPYHIFLPALGVSAGSATLAGVLRLEISHDRPVGQSLRDFLLCSAVLYLAAINFFCN